MRLLLLGGSGQLGHALAQVLPTAGDLVVADRSRCDFRDLDAVRDVVREVAADCVVNAVAYTAVDQAEQDEATAARVNAEAVAVIGEEAAKRQAAVVHFSTDYVFDGTATRPYREDDAPAPVSAYGRTKLAGERALAATNPRHLILRTSWVFGAHGANFLKTMLRLAGERDTLRVVADQFGAPSSVEMLGAVTRTVLEAVSRGATPWGVYHCAPQGSVSWHGYAQFVLQEARARGAVLRAGPDDVIPITTAEYPTPARRPANSRLDTTKLRDTFHCALPEWELGVRGVLSQLLPQDRS
ncbi:MAG: dTDP-4-dehydrorhamnose reductase [Gemmatimonadaceae bacterium]|nr:dTDP-4-dehydrorhamnose reductase [Gemmatimonadaceae bacterium]